MLEKYSKDLNQAEVEEKRTERRMLKRVYLADLREKI